MELNSKLTYEQIIQYVIEKDNMQEVLSPDKAKLIIDMYLQYMVESVVKGTRWAFPRKLGHLSVEMVDITNFKKPIDMNSISSKKAIGYKLSFVFFSNQIKRNAMKFFIDDNNRKRLKRLIEETDLIYNYYGKNYN